jgi:hypothetical protein
VVVTPANATLPTDDTIKLAIGGDTGNLSSSMALNGVQKSCYWEGSETTQQTAHALHVTLDQDTDLPTAYKAYDSSLVALSETGESQVSLDLTPETIATGNLVGTAKSGGGTYRTNSVFLRFDSGAAMQLVDDSPGPNSFSYLVPTIPTSTLTVAASEGADEYDGPFAIAYKTDLAATDKPALQIPTPATPVAPAPDITGVSSTTSFSFTSAAAGPFVVHFSNVDKTGPYEDLWVVTADKQLTIPEVLNGGFALNGNNVHSWNVETHGEFASVDAMAEPEGFWDLFTWEDGPVGPLVDEGSWSVSSSRYFTTAP